MFVMKKMVLRISKPFQAVPLKKGRARKISPAAGPDE
jgi:hypothetical protein